MRTLSAGLLYFAALGSAQVTITHVYNGANTGGNLCPGLFVAITGSNLDGSNGQSTINVGGLPASAVETYGSGTLFAVLPANLSVGETTLTVTYNGATSAPFPITLVAYAPAIAEYNSGYFFPTCPCFGSILNTQPFGISASSPAPPGTQVGALVTGLGVTPVGTPTVTVGGQPVTGIQVQQDGDNPQYYDVVFNVPDIASGAQPTVISIGGVSAPAQTLYVGSALPAITAVENSATGAVESSSHAAAPNSVLSLYVSNAGTAPSVPSSYPTTTVEGIQVLVNGQAVPIYALAPSANQINFQLPSELATTGTATIAVQSANGMSATSTIALGPADVGIFRIPSGAYPNNGAIQIAGTVWDVMPASVAATYGLPSCAGLSASKLCGQPASPGQNIVVYWTGGGPTTPSLPTGDIASPNGSTLYETVQIPLVTIGGIPAAVAFSGIVPGTAGEYQLNLTIPAAVVTGDQVPLVVSIGNSKDTVTIAIAAP